MIEGSSTKEPGIYLFFLSSVMTFSTGIFLTAVRFVEPLFRYLLWQTMYQYYG